MPIILMTRRFAHQVNKLDGTLRSKVLAFMAKIQTGRPGLNIESLKNAADPRVRTARVDLNHRAVMIQAGADVYGLLAVDTHDKANKYAEHVTIGVNTATGALDIFDADAVRASRELEAEDAAASRPAAGQDADRTGSPDKASTASTQRVNDAEAAAAPTAPATSSPLHGWDPAVLVELGIRQDSAEELVAARTTQEAESVAEELPLTQGVIVLDLLAGKDVQAVREEYLAVGEVDTDDLVEAMRRPISQIVFVDAEDSAAVQAAFEGPLAAWRVWLHPTQASLARHTGWNGPYRVTGGAGTGKTVTAIHRARFLCEQTAGRATGLMPAVLLLTYTKNLATTIGTQLDTLAGQRLAGSRVGVLTVDALAHRVLRQSPEGEKWLDGRRALTSSEYRDYVADAADGMTGLPAGLDLAEEIESVILTGAISSRDDYFATPRVGRGSRLSRRQRLSVWKAYERLTNALDIDGRYLWSQVPHRAALLLGRDPDIAERLGIRHVVVDEAQDLTAAHWRLLRGVVPPGQDDLFIVGDAHQRIYGRPVPLSRFGIKTRGRSRRLTVNYRTSKEILSWSLGVADPDADDLDEQSDTLRGARSVFSGPPVDRPGEAGLPPDSDAALTEWLRRLISPDQDRPMRRQEIAVVRVSREGLEDTVGLLTEAEIPAVEVGRTTNEETLPDAVRVMTMHRAKGLEYRAVAVRDASALQHTRDDRRDRNLVYVSATRARERLLVC